MNENLSDGTNNALFLVVGLAFLGFAVVSLYQSQGFVRSAQSVKGKVVALDGSWEKAAVVKFVTRAGETIQFTSTTSSFPPMHSIGDVVDVAYDPANPDHAEISNEGTGFILIFGGIGLVIALLSLTGIMNRR
jgi:hypothetical protein